jgi:thiol-disulfide isomerase/thioredoxin
MRLICALTLSALIVSIAGAQDKSGEPTDLKAQKTYKQALQKLREHQILFALEDFKKADKQDGNHCLACQKQMVKYGIELGEWKTAEQGAEEMIAQAQGQQEIAIAHYQAGIVFFREGLEKHKDEYFARAHEEAGKALATFANFPEALALDGQALARLKQDEQAKAQFQQYLKLRTGDDPERQRIARYIERPELARARMAPAFSVTTADGQRLSLDGMQGKVVLLDFWATWCGPCRDALPHMRSIAKKFQGQPLVILSVSLDTDEQKWKEFVGKNEMTWPQYRDGGFEGSIAKLFGVHAIPHTFTIDSDGVLQEEHIGDASVEGKLKKLLSQVR